MITVILKIRMRDSINSVLKCLNFWLGAFDNKDKYEVFIYNENCNLGSEYNSYNVITRAHLLDDPGCRKLFDKINNSNIHQRWRGACFALSAPYFWRFSNDLVFNIDADDIQIFGPIKSYLEKVEEAFNDPQIFTMSYDMHYSAHSVKEFSRFRPSHFTFGVNLGRKKEMHDIILKGLFNPPVPPPWDLNIDYVVDKALENFSTPYVCWISPNYLIHYIHREYHMNKLSRFDKDKNSVESRLYGSIEYKPKHQRTLLIE
jgi:hypothetical protein